MNRRTLAVVSAGLGQPSSTRMLADSLASAAGRELQRSGGGVDVHVVDLREHAHDIVNAMLSGFAPAPLRAALDTVATADGLIAVTPVFNASYSGLFKSFFDVLDPDALADKPVLLAATGGSARHSLVLDHALRPLFSYLRALVVPTAVFAASEDWAGAVAGGALAERVERAGRQFATLVAAHRPAQARDPFALTATFEQLLAGD